MSTEKLWRYSRLSRLWARTLIVAGVVVLLVGLALEIGDPNGHVARWTGVAVPTVLATTILFMFLLRSWMRDGALPSARLKDATPDTGTPRRLEAAPRDWRSWTMLLGVSVLFAAIALSGFLVGTLGGGGTAEGVVTGVFVAWGIVTARDVRLVDAAEAESGRHYYAACRRPVSVGGRLVWRAVTTPPGP